MKKLTYLQEKRIRDLSSRIDELETQLETMDDPDYCSEAEAVRDELEKASSEHDSLTSDY